MAETHNESQPFGEFIRTVLRYLPLVAIATALVGAGAFVLTTPTPPTPVATSQIGLTQQVVWPFFDTARQRAVTAVEDPAFAAEVKGRLAGAELDVSVDAPDNQAFIIIEVAADSPEVAARAANEAADLLLELDRARLSQTAEAELTRA
ncbi:MAG: hypothetical protein ACR2QK_18405, partial [Acidimicrobiales bacterium]